MSHQMLENDVQLGLEMAWHKLTQIQSVINAFPFELKRQKLQAGDIDTPFEILLGSDDAQIIGKPYNPDTYSVLSNEQFVALAMDSLSGTGAKIASLGTFGGRAKRYLSVSFGEKWEQFSVGDREFKNYLNLHDSLDKTSPLIAKGSNICVVCANTYGFSLKERSEFQMKLRHTKNMADKLENMEEAIAAYRGQTALYKKLFEHAAETPVNEIQARNLFAGFLGDGEEMSTRAKNTVNRLTDLYAGAGKGNHGRTMLDAISAVTDFYTHESSGRNAMKQLESSEIGAGQTAKARFINTLHVDDMGHETFSIIADNANMLMAKGLRSLELSVN